MLNQVVLCEERPIFQSAKIFQKWLRKSLLSKIAVGALCGASGDACAGDGTARSFRGGTMVTFHLYQEI